MLLHWVVGFNEIIDVRTAVLICNHFFHLWCSPHVHRYSHTCAFINEPGAMAGGGGGGGNPRVSPPLCETQLGLLHVNPVVFMDSLSNYYIVWLAYVGFSGVFMSHRWESILGGLLQWQI